MTELRKISIAPQVIDEDSYISEVIKKIEELGNIGELLKKFNVIGYDCDHGEHYGNLSARVSEKEFLCTATQTSGYNELGIIHFPIVYDFINNTIHWKSVRAGHEPSVEASTHDGFYRGNSRIRYIAHGHFQSIHEHCQSSQDSIIFPREFGYGTLEIRGKALESGRDKRILKNETPYGNWGLIIPRGHFNAFFLVGESAKAIKLGFLHCIAHSANKLHNKSLEEALEIEGEPLYEEDFLGTMRRYF